MIRIIVTLLLAAMTAAAQTNAPGSRSQTQQSPALAKRTPASPQAAPSDAAAAQPVITVTGVCTHKKTAPGALVPPCKTVITQQQFDKLLDALNSSHQNITPGMRRNLAQAYVDLLAFAQAAEKAGTENDPRFAEVMQLMRLRTLADLYRRGQEDKFRTPPADEVQAAYNQNPAKFEEVKLSRIFIPSHNPAAQNKDDWEKKAQQTANDMHDRVAKGEAMEKLQVEAYSTLGLTTAPPNTVVGSRRRGMLAPQEEQEVFALTPGGVSKVVQEPAAYIIYKVESKQTLPLDQVKDEISRDIFRQKMSALQSEVTSGVHADYDNTYFGPPPAPPAQQGPQPNPNPAPPKPQPAASPAAPKL